MHWKWDTRHSVTRAYERPRLGIMRTSSGACIRVCLGTPQACVSLDVAGQHVTLSAVWKWRIAAHTHRPHLGLATSFRCCERLCPQLDIKWERTIRICKELTRGKNKSLQLQAQIPIHARSGSNSSITPSTDYPALAKPLVGGKLNFSPKRDAQVMGWRWWEDDLLYTLYHPFSFL